MSVRRESARGTVRFVVGTRWDLATGVLEGTNLVVGDALRVAEMDAVVRVIGFEFHMPAGVVGLVLERGSGTDTVSVGSVLLSP